MKYTPIHIDPWQRAAAIAMQVGLIDPYDDLSDLDKDRFRLFWERVENEIIVREAQEAFTEGMAAKAREYMERENQRKNDRRNRHNHRGEVRG